MHWIALQPEPASPGPADDTLVDPHTALAWWALQFTPIVARVDEVLELVGASSLADRPIGKISGGQLQRAMIARWSSGLSRSSAAS